MAGSIIKDTGAGTDQEVQRLANAWRQITAVWEPDRGIPRLLVHTAVADRLLRLAPCMSEELPCLIILKGKRGSGRRFLMKHMACKKNSLLYLAEDREIFRILSEWGPWALTFLKEELKAAGAYLGVISTLENDGEEEQQAFLKNMIGAGLAFFYLCEKRIVPPDNLTYRWMELEVPPLKVEEREKIWRQFLLGYRADPEVDSMSLANRYAFNPGEIINVLNYAALYSRSFGREVLKDPDIRAGVSALSRNRLTSYAREVPVVYHFQDLVVEGDTKEMLRDVCRRVLCRDTAGEKWGFYDRRAYGKGLSVLFYGPPGTGKTMAAQALAGELGLLLYRVDLSRMMSKYIGETQKNLSSLFEQARDMQVLLFFDEADAFFSRRTEVKDSHDRHSNSEVAHLLQELEEYDGITILATNLKDNIDDAFKRRIKMMIPFFMPGKENRKKLWEKALPDNAPREPDLNLDFFAERFEISGSEIQDILLGAAFTAAAKGESLGNRHVARALKQSFRKYGRVLDNEEFRELLGRGTDET